MRRNEYTSVIFCVVFLITSAVQAQVVRHNGTTSSTPPGTGEVNVVVTDNSTPTTLDANQGFFDIVISVNPNVQHTLTFQGQAGGGTVSNDKAFENNTPHSWGSFLFEIEGGDFLSLNDLSPVPEDNPVGPGLIEFISTNSSIRSSTLSRANGTASLRLFFDDPVDPGDVFSLQSNIQHGGSFVVVESPFAVPEPTSVAIWSLVGIALTGFGYTRIRRKI